MHILLDVTLGSKRAADAYTRDPKFCRISAISTPRQMTYDLLTPNAQTAQRARKQVLSGVLTLGKPTGLKWLQAGNEQMSEGRELSGCPALADALQSQTEFSQQEWDAFGIDDLRVDHYVKAGAHHYRPAGLLDTNWAQEVSFSGHSGQSGTEWGAKYGFISETDTRCDPGLRRPKPVLVLYGCNDVGNGGERNAAYGTGGELRDYSEVLRREPPPAPHNWHLICDEGDTVEMWHAEAKTWRAAAVCGKPSAAFIHVRPCRDPAARDQAKISSESRDEAAVVKRSEVSSRLRPVWRLVGTDWVYVLGGREHVYIPKHQPGSERKVFTYAPRSCWQRYSVATTRIPSTLPADNWRCRREIE